MSAWQAITSFGDSAVLLPLMFWMAVWLAWPPAAWGDILRWVAAVALCGGGVALSKLLFMAWGVGPGGLDYTGFSGHTALSILVWPTLAWLMARHGTLPARICAVGVGALLGAGVAASRLALKVHSPSEVMLGAALGIVVLAWVLAGLARASKAPGYTARGVALLGGGALLICVACYGRVFPSQDILRHLALWLSGHSHVMTRQSPLG
jgi:membrane-associated phospholipid phosphatase